MTAAPITFSCADGVAHIRLTNAAGGNVFDLAMIPALTAAIDRIDPADTRAVLISAEGRNFSLGGDLNGMRAAEDKGPSMRSVSRLSRP
jgi:2-(1,2-epoxy-1,2-dihydrophenyl)acetyl-CoA isomerase